MGHSDLPTEGYDSGQAQINQAEQIVREGIDQARIGGAVEGIALGIKGGVFKITDLPPLLEQKLREKHPDLKDQFGAHVFEQNR